jgi:hypothetical protein
MQLIARNSKYPPAQAVTRRTAAPQRIDQLQENVAAQVFGERGIVNPEPDELIYGGKILFVDLHNGVSITAPSFTQQPIFGGDIWQHD